jgi:hypothetical protein
MGIVDLLDTPNPPVEDSPQEPARDSNEADSYDGFNINSMLQCKSKTNHETNVHERSVSRSEHTHECYMGQFDFSSIKRSKDFPSVTLTGHQFPLGTSLISRISPLLLYLPPTFLSPASQIPLTSVPASKVEWVQSLQSSIKRRDPVSSLTKTSAMDNEDNSSIELSDLFDQVYTKSSEESEVSDHKPAKLAPAFSGAKAQTSPACLEAIFSSTPQYQLSI